MQNIGHISIRRRRMQISFFVAGDVYNNTGEKEALSDLISRQAVIDALMEKDKKLRNINWYDKPYAEGECRGIDEALSIISNLPPVQSERKKGKWIKKMLVTETKKYISYDPEWYCACCGTKYDSHIAKIINFCYVCGADMRGEQNG